MRSKAEFGRDPIERIIGDALTARGVVFEAPAFFENGSTSLDFRVGDVFIECKSYHTDRIAIQTARAANVIVIQGIEAAKWFASMIEK